MRQQRHSLRAPALPVSSGLLRAPCLHTSHTLHAVTARCVLFCRVVFCRVASCRVIRVPTPHRTTSPHRTTRHHRPHRPTLHSTRLVETAGERNKSPANTFICRFEYIPAQEKFRPFKMQVGNVKTVAKRDHFYHFSPAISEMSSTAPSRHQPNTHYQSTTPPLRHSATPSLHHSTCPPIAHPLIHQPAHPSIHPPPARLTRWGASRPTPMRMT